MQQYKHRERQEEELNGRKAGGQIYGDKFLVGSMVTKIYNRTPDRKGASTPTSACGLEDINNPQFAAKADSSGNYDHERHTTA